MGPCCKVLRTDSCVKPHLVMGKSSTAHPQPSLCGLLWGLSREGITVDGAKNRSILAPDGSSTERFLTACGIPPPSAAFPAACFTRAVLVCVRNHAGTEMCLELVRTRAFAALLSDEVFSDVDLESVQVNYRYIIHAVQ